MKKLNDLLWNDKLKIYQDDDYFKYSIDSVLLANFVEINQSYKNILDIGTGNGPIAMLLSLKTKAKITGVEIQKESAQMALDSVNYNKINNISIINKDAKDYAKEVESDSFDLIVSNPPYFRNNNFKSINENKLLARNEEKLNLNDIVLISKKLLKNDGKLNVVCSTDRLIDLITYMKSNNIEPKRLQFIYPKKSKLSNVFLIEGAKNGKPGIKIMNPIYIHNEDDSFNEKVIKILTNFGE